MTPQLSSDEAARLRIKTSLDESLIVEASAGTGKTTALVQLTVVIHHNNIHVQLLRQ